MALLRALAYALIFAVPLAIGLGIFLATGGPHLGPLWGWVAVGAFFAYMGVLNWRLGRRS